MANRDHMRPADWDVKFTITAKGKTRLQGPSPTISTLFTKAGFATRIVRYMARGYTNRWISNKISDSTRVARAITWMLNEGWIRRPTKK